MYEYLFLDSNYLNSSYNRPKIILCLLKRFFYFCPTALLWKPCPTALLWKPCPTALLWKPCPNALLI